MSDISLHASFCSDPGLSWHARCPFCYWESENSYPEQMDCEMECPKCKSEDIEVICE